MRNGLRFTRLLALASMGCGETAKDGDQDAGTMPDPDGSSTPAPYVPECDADGSCVYRHSFPLESLAPGEEINRRCVVWTLENETDLWVNTVRVTNPGGYHHSNWYFVPEDFTPEPDGAFDCPRFNDLAAAVQGGVLFAQSTQSTDETQQFGAGVALRIPKRSRIIANTHLLNVLPNAIETGLGLEIHTVATENVTVRLTPFRLVYNDLKIAPQKRTEVSASCDVQPEFEKTIEGSPFTLKIHYVLPHYHELGEFFELRYVGGPRDGEAIIRLEGGTGEPWGHTFEEPIDVPGAGANGLAFTCGFNNPRTEEVGYGIGDQEMCVMLGFAETPFAFEGSVDHRQTDTVTEVSDELRQTSGPCFVFGVPFMQEGPTDLPPSCVQAAACCPNLSAARRNTCEAAVAGGSAATCQEFIENNDC